MKDYLNPSGIDPNTDRLDRTLPVFDSIGERLLEITVKGGELSLEEARAYVSRAVEVYGRAPLRMHITVDGDYVDIDYTFCAPPFERIRRITGYLVGTTDRFNNAKRAEEHDRVKHAVEP